MPNLQSLSSVHKTEMFLLSIPKCELSSHNFIMVECCINWWPQFNPSISKKSWKEQEKMWIIYRLEIVDRRLWYVWLQFSYCVFNWSDIMSPSGLILIHIDRKPIQARYSFRCEHISSTNHSNNAAIAFGWFDHELYKQCTVLCFPYFRNFNWQLFFFGLIPSKSCCSAHCQLYFDVSLTLYCNAVQFIKMNSFQCLV